MKTSEAKALALLIALDTDIEGGQLGYDASMAIVQAFKKSGHELPEPERRRIWADVKRIGFIFDAEKLRLEEYANRVATATWNKLRRQSLWPITELVDGNPEIAEFLDQELVKFFTDKAF